MVPSKVVTVALLACVATAARGQATTRVAVAPESKLWIEGDSNLHPWSCAATRPESKLEVDLAMPEIARSLDLLVQVDGLECGNGKMNEKLRLYASGSLRELPGGSEQLRRI